MDNNHNDNSINDFDYRLICEYFSSVDRQGPGSDEATLRALSFIPGLTAASHVADLGCGTGSSALLLARTLGCRVTALDLFPDFLDRLRTRADALGLSPRLTTVEASMDSLPFADDAFDAIWSEGAIYNVGFARGLRLWRRHIRSGGFLAVTDATWLTASRPAAIADFWNDAYPQIGTMASNLQALVDAGYTPVAAFVLPDSCWRDNFYLPQRKVQQAFLDRHPGNATAAGLVDCQRREAEMYEAYHSYYGYVFYIARKC